MKDFAVSISPITSLNNLSCGLSIFFIDIPSRIKSHSVLYRKGGISKKKKCLRLFSFSKTYRAVTKRRGAYAAMVRLGTSNFSSACFRKAKDGFEQRTQWKHKPGVTSRKHTSSLCPPCEPHLIFKTRQLKSRRSQAFHSRPAERTSGCCCPFDNNGRPFYKISSPEHLVLFIAQKGTIFLLHNFIVIY
ncbi:MAG: hypothetical protein BWX67_02182 [Thermotogae bacterium ADurb.Bin062]|jgi:hypothetical protein|nr:MAG: hypothetical protein BWX67_02182 [Thermotogota bacterium ADurb.Bin062]